MLAVNPLSCINTLWLGQYVRYVYPLQNPLKYGFSGDRSEYIIILYSVCIHVATHAISVCVPGFI